MISILDKNLILHHGKLGKYTFYEILDFLDLCGHNILHLRNEKIKDGRFCHYFEDEEDVINLIQDNNFRVNLLVIEYNSYTKCQYTIDHLHKSIFSRFQLPTIWFMPNTGTTILPYEKFDTCYRVNKEFVSFESVYDEKEQLKFMSVEDLKSGVTSNLYDLKVAYIRDKKLDDLLGL